jgi:hypothetical protein
MGPLFKLLKKGVEFTWGPQQKEAFKRAKQKITVAPVLKIHDLDLLSTVKIDASDFVIGAELSQPGPDGRLQPVAYFSRKMIPAELNYNIHDKELLAIVTALQYWRIYLEGAKHDITVILDHKNLTYFLTTKVLN